MKKKTQNTLKKKKLGKEREWDKWWSRRTPLRKGHLSRDEVKGGIPMVVRRAFQAERIASAELILILQVVCVPFILFYFNLSTYQESFNVHK